MITFDLLKQDEEINALINAQEKQLKGMGYTEHGTRHLGIVSKRTKQILKQLGCSKQDVELGLISAYLHDIGNAVNRSDHAHSGAILAYQLLVQRGMPFDMATQVMSAIGNHDEATGTSTNKISSALIIADKSDVHRSRVREDKITPENRLADMADVHDRVNFAVTHNQLIVDDKQILLVLGIDDQICSTMDYFEIFLGRMRMCINSAQQIDLAFKLQINGYNLL